MLRIFLIIIIGCCGGLVARKVGIPGGPIVGAMLAAALTGICIPGTFAIPDQVSTGIQILLGISLGMSCDRSTLQVFIKLFPLGVLSTVILLMCAVFAAFLAHKSGAIDFATALFGFSPGGMSGMSLLAQSEGLRIDIVAIMHIIRIFSLFVLVPVLSRFLSGWLNP